MFSNLEYWVWCNLIKCNLEISTLYYCNGTFGVIIIVLFCCFTRIDWASFLCLEISYWWVLEVEDHISLKGQIYPVPSSLESNYKSSMGHMQIILIYWWGKWGHKHMTSAWPVSSISLKTVEARRQD